MLNINSPTVQSMLKNLPQGFGNLPVYMGNTPTITTETVQASNNEQEINNTGAQMPFPSPKEMLISGGQNQIYGPSSFYPQQSMMYPQQQYGYMNGQQMNGYNYNSNISNAFNGYYNPYIGYGTYSGYQQPQPQVPMDNDTLERIEAARANGISYDQQLREESNLYKTISRIVSKNLNRDEEEAKECEKAFDIYNKYPAQEDMFGKRKEIKFLKVSVFVDGKEVVAANSPEKIQVINQDYERNARYVEQMKINQVFRNNAIANAMNQLYMNAPERMLDNMDLLDFFNTGAGILMADSLIRKLYKQNMTLSAQTYDKANFKKRLLSNNGVRSRSEVGAVERFVGRYGIMPDGRPVSPGRDPAIATSFSYDPKTGQYSVTAPNFISDRLERARSAFIRSIDNSQ